MHLLALQCEALESISLGTLSPPPPPPPPSLPPPSDPPYAPSASSPDFGCLEFESMTEVRELGQWCGGGGRKSDPDACHRAYATTFPNDAFTPGYFRAPREYRSPNVRVQRQ
eukprot:5140300-Pleurochrysis_carterae.AAC.1